MLKVEKCYFRLERNNPEYHRKLSSNKITVDLQKIRRNNLKELEKLFFKHNAFN